MFIQSYSKYCLEVQMVKNRGSLQANGQPRKKPMTAAQRQDQRTKKLRQ